MCATVNLDRLAVSPRELLLAMRLLLSLGVAAYNSGSDLVSLDDLHRLEADIDLIQDEMIVL